MAGNKTLRKFKESKIPKKGTGTTSEEVIIYQEPNTHSKIIGKINKNEIVNWISKSICEEKEWIRCDQKNNFGYIVGNKSDGTCNLDLNSIKEIKVEEIDNNINKDIIITKEENDIAEEAFRLIMNEDDEKVNYKNDRESNGSNSTGIDINLNQTNNMYKTVDENAKLFDIKYNEAFKEGLFNNIGNPNNLNQINNVYKTRDEHDKIFEIKNDEVFKVENDDIFNEDNFGNLYYEGDMSNFEALNKEVDQLEQLRYEISIMRKEDKEKENSINKALESIRDDIFPENKNSENNDKDLLEGILDSIPGGKNHKYNLNHDNDKKEDNKLSFNSIMKKIDTFLTKVLPPEDEDGVKMKEATKKENNGKKEMENSNNIEEGIAAGIYFGPLYLEMTSKNDINFGISLSLNSLSFLKKIFFLEDGHYLEFTYNIKDSEFSFGHGHNTERGINNAGLYIAKYKSRDKRIYESNENDEESENKYEEISFKKIKFQGLNY